MELFTLFYVLVAAMLAILGGLFASLRGEDLRNKLFFGFAAAAGVVFVLGILSVPAYWLSVAVGPIWFAVIVIALFVLVMLLVHFRPAYVQRAPQQRPTTW